MLKASLLEMLSVAESCGDEITIETFKIVKIK